MTPDEIRDRARKALADDAEELQAQINQFIGNAIISDVDLPAAVYAANVELLRLTAQIREPAEHPTHPARDVRRRGSGRGLRRLKLLR